MESICHVRIYVEFPSLIFPVTHHLLSLSDEAGAAGGNVFLLIPIRLRWAYIKLTVVISPDLEFKSCRSRESNF